MPDPSWAHGPSCSSQPCLTAPCTRPGTLFGPSNQPVLDPSGTICPFADAAGGWLPLLCTLNCTGVTEEVRMHVWDRWGQHGCDASWHFLVPAGPTCDNKGWIAACS